MSQSHLVDKVSFELVINSSKEAYQLQNLCSQLIHDELQTVMQDVFDKLTSNEQTLVIDNLVVDLGNIDRANFEHEVSEKFKSLLPKAITNQINKSKSNSELTSLDSNIVSRKTIDNSLLIDKQTASWLEIKHFFKTGQRPWNGAPTNLVNIERKLIHLLDSEKAIKQEFKSLTADKNFRQRMFNQLSLTNIQKIYEICFDSTIDFIHLINSSENFLNNPLLAYTNKSDLFESIWKDSLNQLSTDSLLTNYWLVIFTSCEQTQHKLSNQLLLTSLMQSAKELPHIRGLGSENIIASLENLRSKLESTFRDKFNKTRSSIVSHKTTYAKRSPNDNSNQHGAKNTIIPHKATTQNIINTPLNESDLPSSHELDKNVIPLSDNSRNTKIDLQQNLKSDQLTDINFSNSNNASLLSENNNSRELHQNSQIPFPDIERMIIENSGLVLFWPYLNHFFKTLKLINEAKFIDKTSHFKAIHLLHYLSTDEEQGFEYQMALNKVLCGWQLEEPINRFVNISDQEKTEANNLINAVITNWSALGKTSVQSFKQTFVKRQGILELSDTGWLLKVEKGPYDILFDRLPWGISMIKLSWMKGILTVEW